MKVAKYLRIQREIFEQEQQKLFKVTLPVHKNANVTAVFEKQDGTDGPSIRAEVCSSCVTENGTFAMKASTDEPSCVEFKSASLLNPLGARFEALVCPCGLTVLTAGMTKDFGLNKLQGCARIDLEKWKSGYSINGSIRQHVIHPNHSVSLEVFTEMPIASLDAFLHNNMVRIGFNTCGDWARCALLDARFMLETTLAATTVIASTCSVSRSVDLSCQRQFNNRLTTAALVSMRNLGYSPDFLCEVAAKCNFDANTSAKCCVRSDRLVTCTLDITYLSNAHMQFTSSIPTNSLRDSTFGATVSFDLTDKLKL